MGLLTRFGRWLRSLSPKKPTLVLLKPSRRAQREFDKAVRIKTATEYELLFGRKPDPYFFPREPVVYSLGEKEADDER